MTTILDFNNTEERLERIKDWRAVAPSLPPPICVDSLLGCNKNAGYAAHWLSRLRIAAAECSNIELESVMLFLAGQNRLSCRQDLLAEAHT